MESHHEEASANLTDANLLVEQHLYLVDHLVHQVGGRYPRHVDRRELWSSGAAGLVDASRRFDPDAGVPFARYASIRIRGAIIDATRTRDWATRSLRRGMRGLSDATAKLQEAHGREPSTEELAAELGTTVDEVEELRHQASIASLLHLDQPSGGDEDGEQPTLFDQLQENATWRLPDEAIEQRELIGTVRTAVGHLPDTQREVLERYFFGGELLQDIAATLGVTEARVSQLRAEALNALRAYFETTYDGVEAVPESAPGIRRRATYVAAVSERSTWRSRLEAGHLPTQAPIPSSSYQTA